MKRVRFSEFLKVLAVAATLNVYGGDLALAKGGCLEEHFRLAAELNRARAKVYSEMTGGASRSISRNLIWFETLGRVLVVPSLEAKAKIYWEKNEQIICDELGDMASVSPLQTEVVVPSQPLAFNYIKSKVMAKVLMADLKREDYAGIFEHSENLISKLNEQPQYNCLTRHFLESIRKIAHHVSAHRTAALDSGLKDPKKLIAQYLKLQIRSLRWTVYVDKKAAPLQSKGVEIICRDIPAIPL